MSKKISEEIYPFGSQHPKLSNVTAITRALSTRERRRDLNPKERALKKSMTIQSKLFGGKPMKESPKFVEGKESDRIFTMAFVKECRNLSKEDKLTLLEYIVQEPDIKKVVKVVEKYVELDEKIWERVVEATGKCKALSFTNPKKSKPVEKLVKGNEPLRKVVRGK